MAEFMIFTTARVTRSYVVEAASAEEARKLWSQGGYQPLEENDQDERVEDIDELPETKETP